MRKPVRGCEMVYCGIFFLKSSQWSMEDEKLKTAQQAS